MTGRPSASDFEENAGQSLGEARQNHCAGGQNLIEDSLVIQVAGESNVVLHTKLIDEPLDLAAHRAVARDDKLDVNAPFQQTGHRMDQNRLALLLDDPTDIHHPRGIRNRRRSMLQVHRVDTGIDDVDLGPIAVFGPAEKLASREMADSDNESGMADLLSQAEGTRRIELFGTVERDAKRRTTQDTAQHRDGGGICAEVGMQMPCTRIRPVDGEGSTPRPDKSGSAPVLSPNEGPSRRPSSRP